MTSKVWMPPAAEEAPKRPCLLFLTGVEAGRVLSLDFDSGPLTLGREETCSIQIASPEISRRHTQLSLSEDARPQLTDLGSLNGTYLNGRRVTASPLSRGDKIRLGPHMGFKLIFQDDEDYRYVSQLYEQAHSDYLTGIANRRFFMQAYDREWERCRRHDHQLSLAMIDIDYFKAVNDEHGHVAGDQILRMLVDRIKECLTADDTLARYGGEEFILMMPETDHKSAVAKCERIRMRLAETPFETSKGLIRVTVSIGVGMATGVDFEVMVAKRLLSIVDECLYLAKDNGRNRVEAEPEGASKFRWTGNADPTQTII